MRLSSFPPFLFLIVGLSVARSLLADTAITSTYSTSSGAITSGTYDISGAGSIFLNTAGGISGGTLNFDGLSSFLLSGGGTVTGGTFNYDGSSSGPISIAGFNPGTITNATFNLTGVAASGDYTTYNKGKGFQNDVINLSGKSILTIAAATSDSYTINVSDDNSTVRVSASFVSGVNIQASAGTIQPLSGGSHLINSQITLSGTAQLQADSGTFLDGTDSLTMNGGTVTFGDASATIATLNGSGGEVRSSSATSLQVTGSGNSNYSGTISDGDGQILLQKSGSGTMTLSGNNTFSGGTTVMGGKLVANGHFSEASGNSSLGYGQTTVQSGATLAGYDTIVGFTDVMGGGHLAPTRLSFMGGADLEDGAVLDFDLSGAGSLIIGNGVLNWDNTVVINLLGTPGLGSGVYELIDFGYAEGGPPADSGFILTSVGAGQLSDYTLFFQGNDLMVRYTGSAVPEPAAWGLIVGCAALAGVLIRRRSRPLAA